jgi:hypothetical protein
MTRLRFNIAMSLDGYVAGPDQSEESPVGTGCGQSRAIGAPGVAQLKYRIVKNLEPKERTSK